MPETSRWLDLTARNFWLWFGSIWLFCGLPFLIIGLYIGAQNIHVNKRLAAEGRTVEGMVLTKAVTSSSSSSSRGSSTPTYEVTFRFVTPDGLVTGSAEVTAEAWDRLVEREPIRVTYVPDAPQYHRVEGQTSGWILPVILTVIGGIFTSLGSFIVLRARTRLHTRAPRTSSHRVRAHLGRKATAALSASTVNGRRSACGWARYDAMDQDSALRVQRHLCRRGDQRDSTVSRAV